MQQNLIAPTAEKYLSGVALNAGSSEETTAVQNADLLDRRGYLENLFYLSLNMHDFSTSVKDEVHNYGIADI